MRQSAFLEVTRTALRFGRGKGTADEVLAAVAEHDRLQREEKIAEAAAHGIKPPPVPVF